MSLIKSLTPKNTEEVKPGLWIQKRKSGKYHQVLPFAWEGKWLWKEQLKTVFTFRTLATILIISFIAWSYVHDDAEIKNAYWEIVNNQGEFCAGNLDQQEIFDKYGNLGLGVTNPNLNTTIPNIIP